MDGSLRGPGSAGSSIERDLVYTPPDWPAALTADLYRPSGSGLFPGVVTVHGGSWSRRSRRDMQPIARKLMRRGYVVLNISYRFAPAHRHPAQLEDVQQAIRWLRGQANRLRLDPGRIGGWGYSAGAHLIALAAAVAGRDPETGLRAVVAGGMPADLPRYPNSPLITALIGARHSEDPQAWAEASPARRVSAHTPPMFLYHGARDTLVHAEDARTMKAALERASVPCELYLIPWAGHISTYLFGFGAEGTGMAFLDRLLGEGSALQSR